MIHSDLQQLRLAAGLTQETLAEAIGASPSAVRAWEAGRRTPKPRFRPALARALGLDNVRQLNRLIGIESPIELEGQEVPSWLNTYESLVMDAGRLDTVEKAHIPAMLQTRAYATAIERYGPLTLTDEQVCDRVDVRLQRQAVLRREEHPLELVVLLAESVLFEVVDNHTLMSEQLDHLVEMAERSNITLRLLPRDGRSACVVGNFDVVTRRGHAVPFMVFSFSAVGQTYHDLRPIVRIFLDHYDYLAGVALSPEDSSHRIREIRETYR